MKNICHLFGCIIPLNKKNNLKIILTLKPKNILLRTAFL